MVVSEVMMTSLFVEFLCRVLAVFSNLCNDHYCLWHIVAGTVAENYVHLRIYQKQCESLKSKHFLGHIPDRSSVFMHVDLYTVAPLLL